MKHLLAAIYLLLIYFGSIIIVTAIAKITVQMIKFVWSVV